jgi:hypothetical protein
MKSHFCIAFEAKYPCQRFGAVCRLKRAAMCWALCRWRVEADADHEERVRAMQALSCVGEQRRWPLHRSRQEVPRQAANTGVHGDCRVGTIIYFLRHSQDTMLHVHATHLSALYGNSALALIRSTYIHTAVQPPKSHNASSLSPSVCKLAMRRHGCRGGKWVTGELLCRYIYLSYFERFASQASLIGSHCSHAAANSSTFLGLLREMHLRQNFSSCLVVASASVADGGVPWSWKCCLRRSIDVLVKK